MTIANTASILSNSFSHWLKFCCKCDVISLVSLIYFPQEKKFLSRASGYSFRWAKTFDRTHALKNFLPHTESVWKVCAAWRWWGWWEVTLGAHFSLIPYFSLKTEYFTGLFTSLRHTTLNECQVALILIRANKPF